MIQPDGHIDPPINILLVSSDNSEMGKSTLCQYICKIVNTYNSDAVALEMSFAYRLKKEVCRVFGLNFEQILSDTSYKKLHRQKFIDHGQRMRALNPNHWCEQMVEYLFEEINYLPVQNKYVSPVSDTRFANEIDFMKKQKWAKVKTCHIFVSPESMAQRINDPQKFTDWLRLGKSESEIELKGDSMQYDYLIDNSGPLYWLEDRALKICKQEGWIK